MRTRRWRRRRWREKMAMTCKEAQRYLVSCGQKKKTITKRKQMGLRGLGIVWRVREQWKKKAS